MPAMAAETGAGQTLALRAVAVAAGVVSDAGLATILAAFDMAAERHGLAGLDRRHDAALTEGHAVGLLGAIGGAVGRTPGDQLGGITISLRRSSGLVVSAIRVVATCV
jgi:hypothetical protein